MLAAERDPVERGSADAALRERWRADGEAVAVRISTQSGAGTEAEVFVRALAGAMRAKRALVALAVCWALAAVSVLIPVAHFALVPGLAIAGPIVAWLRYRQRSLVLGGIGDCPACGGRIRIAAQAEEWPLATECSRCPEMLSADRR